MKLDNSIKNKILRESQKRRDKRVKFCVSDEEHAELITMSIELDMNLGELIRKKLFGEKNE